MDSTQNFEQTLVNIFSLEQFRSGQREIISSVLSQKDVLAVLPTGGGKSLCYQFPAVYTKSLVIVISPLIALMKDQVSALRARGIKATCLYSGQTLEEKRQYFSELEQPGAALLYVSPERVQKEGFKNWVQGRKIALFAIDEAHCVSQWGHDFREEYAQLAVLKELRPDVPVLALTASATPTVLKDIVRNLKLKTPEHHVHGFYRPNLYYQVAACVDEDAKWNYLLEAIKQTPKGRILIYCGTRKITEQLASSLQQKFAEVGFYHAGLSPQERNQTQESYMRGELRVLVATNAFGMGLDQPDVRLVVHYQMPANIDSLYQEMGRAGRDGKMSTCLLLYSKKDKGLQSYFIQTSPAPAEIKASRWRTLDALVSYSEGGECRHAEILTYYRDRRRIQGCGHCDVCDPSSQHRVAEPKIIVAPSVALKKKSQGKSSRSSGSADVVFTSSQEDLYQRLRQWRKNKSQEEDVPAFVIFSDRTLKDMVVRLPQNLDQLRVVYGVGDSKLEKYGWDVLAELQDK